MTRFRFTLEALLRHREDLEQKERDELLRLNYQYQLELKKRNELISRKQATSEEFALKQADHQNQQEWVWYHLYLKRLSEDISESEKRLIQWKAKIEAQKTVVIEASKKRKTLASMKAKKKKEFVMALEKQEQKEVDDLVTTRFGFKEPG